MQFSFNEKEAKKEFEGSYIKIILNDLESEELINFRDDRFSIKRLKLSFIYPHWLKTKLFTNVYPSSLISFFYYLGFTWGCSYLFWPFFFCFHVFGGSILLYIFCIPWVTILAALPNNFLIYPPPNSRRERENKYIHYMQFSNNETTELWVTSSKYVCLDSCILKLSIT